MRISAWRPGGRVVTGGSEVSLPPPPHPPDLGTCGGGTKRRSRVIGQVDGLQQFRFKVLA